MADDFGAAIYHEPEVDDTPQDSPDSGIDLNDPSLLMQEIDGDPNVDAYATPPPPPDGWYRMKLKHIDVKRKDGTKHPYKVVDDIDYKTQKPVMNEKTGKQQTSIHMAVEARIQDPGGTYDNIPVFDYGINTKVNKRTKGVTMFSLLNALKVKIPQPYNGKTVIELMTKALASEPDVDVEVVWEGSPDQGDGDRIKAAGEQAPRVRGMHNFPEVDGKRMSDVKKTVPKIGEIILHAQARVAGYAPAGTRSKKK